MVTVHAEVPTKPAVTYDVEAYYDGDCPLCTKEVAMLRSLDRHGRIRFTDFTAPGFDATRPARNPTGGYGSLARTAWTAG